jgi:hypothetical protein
MSFWNRQPKPFFPLASFDPTGLPADFVSIAAKRERIQDSTLSGAQEQMKLWRSIKLAFESPRSVLAVRPTATKGTRAA